MKKVQSFQKPFFLALLLLGLVRDILAQGGPCMSDTECNSATGGGVCNLGPNSCICLNGYTGPNCQTPPPSDGGSTSTNNVSNINRTILLLTLATSFFIFLRDKQSRELDQDLYNALYRAYIYR